MPGKIRGLFRWCLKVTEGYEGIELLDMTTSWKNGLAFCAIINRFRPDLIDFYSLSPDNVYDNNNLAFSIMEKEYDIPRLLDPTDMVEMDCPDRYSIATYVSSFYECFNDKPMHEPPPVPENWTANQNKQKQNYVHNDKEERHNKSKSNGNTVQKDKKDKNEKSQEVLNANKSDLKKSDKTSEIEKVSNTNPSIPDCDIDDLYTESIGLLDNAKGEGELETVHESSYKQLCKSSIDDIKSSKPGVVLQAMVMAGVTAVAPSTIGDDAFVHGKPQLEEEISENNNQHRDQDALVEYSTIEDDGFVSGKPQLEKEISKKIEKDSGNLKDVLVELSEAYSDSTCNTPSNPIDNEIESSPPETELNQTEVDFKVDDSLADSGCDMNSVLNNTAELESVDLNSTLASVNTELTLEMDKTTSDPQSKELGCLDDSVPQDQVIDQTDTINDKSHLETEEDNKDVAGSKPAAPFQDNHRKEDKEEPEQSNDAVITKETVDILNQELNKGEFKIEDVNVVEDSDTDPKSHVLNEGNEKCTSEKADSYIDTDSPVSNLEEKEDTKEEKDHYSQLTEEVDSHKSDEHTQTDEKDIKDTHSIAPTVMVESINIVADNCALKHDDTKESDPQSRNSDDEDFAESMATDIVKDALDEMKSNSDQNSDLVPEVINKFNDYDSQSQNSDEESFADSMATDIVKDVFDEIKSNPDELDAGKDISSIMKEIEADMEVQRALQGSPEMLNDDNEFQMLCPPIETSEGMTEEISVACAAGEETIKEVETDIVDTNSGIKQQDLSRDETPEETAVSKVIRTDGKESINEVKSDIGNTNLDIKQEEPPRDETPKVAAVITDGKENINEEEIDIVSTNSCIKEQDSPPEEIASSPEEIAISKITCSDGKEDIKEDIAIVNTNLNVKEQDSSGDKRLDETDGKEIINEEETSIVNANSSIKEKDGSSSSDGKDSSDDEGPPPALPSEGPPPLPVVGPPILTSKHTEHLEGEPLTDQGSFDASICPPSLTVDIDSESRNIPTTIHCSNNEANSAETVEENENFTLKDPDDIEQPEFEKGDSVLEQAVNESFNINIDGNLSQPDESIIFSKEETSPSVEEKAQEPLYINTDVSETEMIINPVDIHSVNQEVLHHDELESTIVCEKEIHITDTITEPTIDKFEECTPLSSSPSLKDQEIEHIGDKHSETVELNLGSIMSHQDAEAIEDSAQATSSINTDSELQKKTHLNDKSEDEVYPIIQSEDKDKTAEVNGQECVELPEQQGPSIENSNCNAEIAMPLEIQSELPKVQEVNSETIFKVENAESTIKEDLKGKEETTEMLPVKEEEPKVELSENAEKPKEIENPDDTADVQCDLNNEHLPDEESVKALPVRKGAVTLDWSTRVSDSNGNIAKEVSVEFTTPISCDDADTDISQGQVIEKSFAEIDKDLLRKAAIMSRQMAEKVTMKILEDQNIDLDKSEDVHDMKDDKVLETPSTPPPSPAIPKDSAKERRQTMFAMLQNSTRPTKKKFDEEESESKDNKDLDFASKMKMWNRRSFTGDPPSRKVSSDVIVPRKRVSLSSPFLSIDNVSTEETDTHMARLTNILPDKPAPGSVAEYIRKLSEKKSPTPDEAVGHKSRFDRYDSDSASEKSFDGKEPNINALGKGLDYDQRKDDLDTGKTVHMDHPNTKDIKPSSIFAARPLARMRPKNQNIKLAVRPLSLEVKYIGEDKSIDAAKPPIPPARQSRKSLSRVDLDVKPLERKSSVGEDVSPVSDKDDSYKLKCQDSLRKRTSPRRSLSLSSPTRPEVRSNSEEREINIWKDQSAKPPSPKLKRNDSFEIKIRPVTKQRSQEEKAEAKKERELERENSFKSTSRPPTPPKTQGKVDISVKPVTALEVTTQDEKEEPRVTQKTGRKSLLSLIGSFKEPKQEDNSLLANVNDEQTLTVSDAASLEAAVPEHSTLDEAVSEHKQITKKSGSKLYNVIKASVKEGDNKKAIDKPIESKRNDRDNIDVTCETDGPIITENIVPTMASLAESSIVMKADIPEAKRDSYQQEKEKTITKCNSIFSSAKLKVNDHSDIKGIQAVENSPKINEVEHAENFNIEVLTDDNNDKNKDDEVIPSTIEPKVFSSSPAAIESKVTEPKDSTVTKSQSKDGSGSNSSSDDSSDDDSEKRSSSLNSSAEIDRPEIKEGLKSIIKEIEDEMDTQEPNENSDLNKESDKTEHASKEGQIEMKDTDIKPDDHMDAQIESVIEYKPVNEIPSKVQHTVFKVALNERQPGYEEENKENEPENVDRKDNVDVETMTKKKGKKKRSKKKETCSSSSSESNKSDTDSDDDHDDKPKDESQHSDKCETIGPNVMSQGSNQDRKISCESGKSSDSTETQKTSDSDNIEGLEKGQEPQFDRTDINKKMIEGRVSPYITGDTVLRDESVIEKDFSGDVSLHPLEHEYIFVDPKENSSEPTHIDNKEGLFEDIINAVNPETVVLEPKERRSAILDCYVNSPMFHSEDNKDLITDTVPVKDIITETPSDSESSSSSSSSPSSSDKKEGKDYIIQSDLSQDAIKESPLLESTSIDEDKSVQHEIDEKLEIVETYDQYPSDNTVLEIVDNNKETISLDNSKPDLLHHLPLNESVTLEVNEGEIINEPADLKFESSILPSIDGIVLHVPKEKLSTDADSSTHHKKDEQDQTSHRKESKRKSRDRRRKLSRKSSDSSKSKTSSSSSDSEKDLGEVINGEGQRQERKKKKSRKSSTSSSESNSKHSSFDVGTNLIEISPVLSTQNAVDNEGQDVIIKETGYHADSESTCSDTDCAGQASENQIEHIPNEKEALVEETLNFIRPEIKIDRETVEATISKELTLSSNESENKIETKKEICKPDKEQKVKEDKNTDSDSNSSSSSNESDDDKKKEKKKEKVIEEPKGDKKEIEEPEGETKIETKIPVVDIESIKDVKIVLTQRESSTSSSSESEDEKAVKETPSQPNQMVFNVGSETMDTVENRLEPDFASLDNEPSIEVKAILSHAESTSSSSSSESEDGKEKQKKPRQLQKDKVELETGLAVSNDKPDLDIKTELHEKSDSTPSSSSESDGEEKDTNKEKSTENDENNQTKLDNKPIVLDTSEKEVKIEPTQKEDLIKDKDLPSSSSSSDSDNEKDNEKESSPLQKDKVKMESGLAGSNDKLDVEIKTELPHNTSGSSSSSSSESDNEDNDTKKEKSTKNDQKEQNELEHNAIVFDTSEKEVKIEPAKKEDSTKGKHLSSSSASSDSENEKENEKELSLHKDKVEIETGLVVCNDKPDLEIKTEMCHEKSDTSSSTSSDEGDGTMDEEKDERKVENKPTVSDTLVEEVNNKQLQKEEKHLPSSSSSSSPSASSSSDSDNEDKASNAGLIKVENNTEKEQFKSKSHTEDKENKQPTEKESSTSSSSESDNEDKGSNAGLVKLERNIGKQKSETHTDDKIKKPLTKEESSTSSSSESDNEGKGSNAGLVEAESKIENEKSESETHTDDEIKKQLSEKESSTLSSSESDNEIKAREKESSFTEKLEEGNSIIESKIEPDIEIKVFPQEECVIQKAVPSITPEDQLEFKTELMQPDKEETNMIIKMAVTYNELESGIIVDSPKDTSGHEESSSSSSSDESDKGEDNVDDDVIISDIDEVLPKNAYVVENKLMDEEKDSFAKENESRNADESPESLQEDITVKIDIDNDLVDEFDDKKDDKKDEFVENDNKFIDEKDKNDIRPSSTSSSSSHSSSSSKDSASEDKPDVINSNDLEDDLLKIVIEDSQPFKAPLLETMITTDTNQDEKEDNKSTIERAESSDDLYTTNKEKQADENQYLLPECNMVMIDYDDDNVNLKGNNLPYNILDIDYKPDPVDIQVFVIPDCSVDKPIVKDLEEKGIIYAEDESTKREMNFEPAYVLDNEHVPNAENTRDIFYDAEDSGDILYDDLDNNAYLSPRELNEIVLEPLLDNSPGVYTEQGSDIESEDELLRNILEDQTSLPIKRRKKSTSSSSSSSSSSDGDDDIENYDDVTETDKHDRDGDLENYDNVTCTDEHVYQSLEDEDLSVNKHENENVDEEFEDGVIYEDIDEDEFDKSCIDKKKHLSGISATENNNESAVSDLSKDRDDKVEVKQPSNEDSNKDSNKDAILTDKLNKHEERKQKHDVNNDVPKKPDRKTKHSSKSSESSSSSSSSSSSDSEDECRKSNKSGSASESPCDKPNKDSKSECEVRDVIEAQIIPASVVLAQAQTPTQLEAESNFMIGREKDPSKSEVARLVQQSLELDRLHRQEQERLQEQVVPRDEVLERDHHNKVEREEENVDLDESSVEDEVEAEEKEISENQFSEEYQAGEATPMSMPSGVDTDNSVSSPEEGPVVEVFDLQESSSEDISPDMESQALFVKLKEAQCKNAVLEAELAKLKARLIVLENSEAQKKQFEKKNEEMSNRLRETEKALMNARKEINHYQDLLEGSQGQYIKLEKKMSGDFTALEKKYHKAKKLIKEYQQRERDFLAERESLLQQQTEKDQQYNALVKSLKDKIFLLERDLREAQKAAGLPVLGQPKDQGGQRSEPIVTPVSAQSTKSAPPVHDSGSVLSKPLADRDSSLSSESEVTTSDLTSPEEFKSEKVNLFESMPVTQPLDTSVSKAKAQAANNSRRPPTKQRSKSQDSDEMIESTGSNKDESGLETWIKHDSDNTVKKSDVRKRKAKQQGSDPQPLKSPSTPEVEPESPSIARVPEIETRVTDASLPSPPPPPSVPQTSSLPDNEPTQTTRERNDSESEDTSSTVSQSSYDPSNPSFRNKDSEIPSLAPSTVSTTESQEVESETSSLSAKKSKGFNLPKLPFKFGGGERDKGGVMLVSSRSLNTGDDATSGGDGGITLISKRRLDTGGDFDGASTISTVSDTSSGYMVGEAEPTSYNFSGTPANEDHPSQASPHSHNQFQSCPISEWNIEHVRNWLIGVEMEKYIPLFNDQSITGLQLVNMDANKFKALGISSSKDRDLLKKKVKELKLVLDKERKQQEKERKQLEKEQKLKEKEQKKLLSKKK